MAFNSLHFLIFLPSVVALYFVLPPARRWILLLLASYYFYACWQVEYLLLIILSTLVDYVAALAMANKNTRRARRPWLILSLAVNLGMLFAFKYFNFAMESIESALAPFNVLHALPELHVLLPVGISFYTFQTLSYTIDVYRGERPPERHLGIFAVYVAFFPQLVAGPIERSTALMPQFRQTHTWCPNRALDGVQLMLWGFFKKLVVADRLTAFVDVVFATPEAYSGLPVLVAAYFFTFQIYCDFSGYSDIAIGAARVMGYDLRTNFAQPYLATGIRDFWQRWHISLTTWFRDYVYLPLGGSRQGALRFYRNVLVVFLVSGLWHGANWTFVCWGAIHAVAYTLERLSEGVRARLHRLAGLHRVPALHTAAQVFVTFHIVVLAYVFFRAETIRHAGGMLKQLFTAPWWPAYVNVGLPDKDFWVGWAAMLVVILVERFGTTDEARSPFGDRILPVRVGFCYALAMGIFVFGVFVSNPFIYFQF